MQAHTYGIGQNADTREYTVYIDGQIVASYPFLGSALAHIEAHRSQEGSSFDDESSLAIATLAKFLRQRAQGGQS